MMSAMEVERSRPVVLLGLGRRPTALRRGQPAGQADQHRRHPVPRGRRQRQEGRRSSATRRTPSPSFRSARTSRLFGARQSLSLMVKPVSPAVLPAAMDDATVALRVAAAAEGDRARQLRHVHVRHAARHLPPGDDRHLRGARRRRRAVAGRRRHRHHEHHADGGQRADARDRPAQGARRAAPGHHVAGAHRVGDAVDLRRRRRHRARLPARAAASRRCRRCRRGSSPGRSSLGVGITAASACSSARTRPRARPGSIRSRRCRRE